MLEKWVFIQCNDGNIYFAILRSFDQKINIILTNCYQIIVNKEEINFEDIGGFMVRGDTITFIGLIGD